MWWNQMPPWMQGMGQGQPGQGLTPGAGMPPYRHAPMNMQTPQMAPPGSIPGAPPPQAPPAQQPINPAQMGMLSQMLAQQTQKPGGGPPGMVPTAGGQPVPGYGAVTEPSMATGAMTGAVGSPAGAAAAAPGGILGLLQQWGIIPRS